MKKMMTKKEVEKMLSNRIEAILKDEFLGKYSEKEKQKKKIRAKELKENKDKFKKVKDIRRGWKWKQMLII